MGSAGGAAASLRCFRGVRLHNCLASPHCPVSHRTRVLGPADRKQFRQQVRDFAKRRQRRISRRHKSQFGRHGRGLEIKRRRALRHVPILAGAGDHAPNPERHVTEQRAECRGVMSLAGQFARTNQACAAMLPSGRDLCRDDFRLDRGRELFRHGETKPEIGQTFALEDAADAHRAVESGDNWGSTLLLPS